MAKDVKECMVADLIDSDLHCWRRDLILDTFHINDAKAICNIPLSRRKGVDSVVWLHTKNGVYSVRSGYHKARKEMIIESWAKSSSSAEGQQIWKVLWGLKVPSKLKVFGWRACHEILPTRVNLTKRKILENVMCHCCKRFAETALHAMWDCGAAQDVWAGSITSLQKWSTSCHDFRGLFEALMDRLQKEKLEIFLVQAWLIWNQRNTVIHGGHLREPGWLNKRAEEFLEEYRKAQPVLTPSNESSGSCIWRAPPAKEFKLNFDATVFYNQHCSGFGAIIRNSSGEVMASMSVTGPYVNSSKEAEVLACRRAVEFSRGVGFSRVIIEGDCLNVMRALSVSIENSSLLGHIYEDIKFNLRGMQVLSINWVKRGGNMVAHTLAKHARNLLNDLFWIEDTPPPAADALYYDSLHINE